MPKVATNSIYYDREAPVLRFEESDDFQDYATAPGSYTTGHPSASASASTAAIHGSSAGGSIVEDPFSELKHKQESLLKLRQELERTQRETEELEAQRRKEERFATGRRDISEKISRNLARLERELYNAQKIIEEISVARESFEHHLDALRSIKPEAWKRCDLNDELDRAIGAVEDAENEYGKASRRLATVLPGGAQAGHPAGASGVGGGPLPQDFRGWLQAGAAFTLPLTAAALLLMVLAKFFL
jgi:hypothetical protein